MKIIINIYIIIIYIFIISIKSSSSSSSSSSYQPKFKELFKPTQLVYPDQNHETLIINETSLNQLNTLLEGESLSVLGVVGTFHSGKSFLLNQILGTTDSFKVGPTVHPQTLGIWMWACKLNIENKEQTLLLLDTEGFYSSNVSESYDAKIFSITTLLSSHLIYNSVKIIDQSSLEYLELLSRRTQLFALKSKIKSSEIESKLIKDSINIDTKLATMEKSSNLEWSNVLSFPSLTWVVQDFFQDIGDQTPTEWLNQLLKSHSRDQLDSSLSISEIFPSIQCHTLFIPSGDKETLRHLNRAKMTDLNPVYIRELNQLIDSLFQSLKPSLSGPSIGTLLKLLVQVANSNNFPKVPSIWSGFIKQQQQSALDDSLQAYKEKITSFRSTNPPLSYQQFIELQKHSFEYSSNLYKQLLFGLEEAYKPGLVKLNDALKENFEIYQKENSIRIRQYCQNIYNQLSNEQSNQLDQLKLPIPSKKLNSILNDIQESTIREYKQKNLNYKESIEHYQFFLQSLEKDVDRLTIQKQTQNKNEMENLLLKAGLAIAERYKQSMNQLDYPITLNQLSKEHGSLYKTYQDKFKQSTQLAESEVYYSAYEAMAEKKLQQIYQEIIEYNEKKILEKAKLEAESSMTDFKKNVGNTIYLPMEEDLIVKQMNKFRQRSISSFTTQLQSFRDSQAYSNELKRLESYLEYQIELKIQENVTQMKWIVKESLDTVKTMMKSRVNLYWLQHSFESEARREAEKRIGGKIKSKVLLDKVINQFIYNDLKTEMDSLFTYLSVVGSILLLSFVSIITTLIFKNK